MYRVRESISEAERLALLQSYSPDTLQDDPELGAITKFAAQLAGTPTALVSLVEDDRQRFLAREGLDATETPRSISFCQHAMVGDGIMEIRDASKDALFQNNPLVTGEPHIHFYAGAPLVGDEGEALGSLCVISPEPRPEGLSDFQREGLSVLAQAVMRRLKDRRAHLSSQNSQARFEALGDAIPQMAWSTLPDGMVDYFNRRWSDFTGAPVEGHFGNGWVEVVHEDDREAARVAWGKAVGDGSPYEVEYRMKRHDGEWRWTLARGLPMRGADGAIDRWFGTNTDIHERRMMVEQQDLLTRELSHRIKNIFSVVSGIIHLEARANPGFEQVAQTVTGRISALGRAHDYVRPGGRGDGTARASLKAVLEDLFAPYADAGGAQIRVGGDDVEIGEDAVMPLALLFHELATNAAKYGALSVAGGKVAIALTRDGDMVRFAWTERGGPDAGAGGEGSPGFGNRLIATAVEKQLRGTIERRWQQGGLEVTVAVPVERLG